MSCDGEEGAVIFPFSMAFLFSLFSFFSSSLGLFPFLNQRNSEEKETILLTRWIMDEILMRHPPSAEGCGSDALTYGAEAKAFWKIFLLRLFGNPRFFHPFVEAIFFKFCFYDFQVKRKLPPLHPVWLSIISGSLYFNSVQNRGSIAGNSRRSSRPLADLISGFQFRDVSLVNKFRII